MTETTDKVSIPLDEYRRLLRAEQDIGRAMKALRNARFWWTDGNPDDRLDRCDTRDERDDLVEVDAILDAYDKPPPYPFCRSPKQCAGPATGEQCRNP